jgi:uncharacterized protein
LRAVKAATAGNSSNDGRIHLIDHLRGLALIAILLVHAVEHFSLYEFPVSDRPWLAALDQKVMHLSYLLFFGKAHAVFALLFGVSYHIQEMNNRRKGIPHRERMLHRMLWLFAFGVLHGLFYPGDILCMLALFGMIMVLFAGLPDRFLLILALVMAVQPLLLWKTLMNDATPLMASEAGLIQEMIASLRDDPFLKVMLRNLWPHRIAEWMASISSGRIFQIGAWMFVGVVAARAGYFYDLKRFKKLNVILLALAATAYVLLAIAGKDDRPLVDLLARWKEMLMVIIYITAAMLVASRWERPHRPSLLAAYGRMSLTNYVFQGILGALLFYGAGLALYRFGATISVATGVLILMAQMIFTYWWTRRNVRGPLENLWMNLTARTHGSKRRS